MNAGYRAAGVGLVAGTLMMGLMLGGCVTREGSHLTVDERPRWVDSNQAADVAADAPAAPTEQAAPATAAAEQVIATTPVLAPPLSTEQARLARENGFDVAELNYLRSKPLFEFDEREVGVYVAWLQKSEPNLRGRVLHLARKGLGQPYSLHLLGEYPLETHDENPLYSLDRSDCVVFCEHIYAMALSEDWPSFMRMLQRIRYMRGDISVVTRNHYTEVDWNTSNAWLLQDITRDLAGDAAVPFTMRVNRASMLKSRFGIEMEIPIATHDDAFIPYEKIMEVADQLREGDFVNVVSGRPGSYWVNHVGMISIGADGTVNFLHSTPPRVREEPLAQYIARSASRIAERDAEGRARFFGMKFLRLQENPMANLRELDGPEAPRTDPRLPQELLTLHQKAN